ncbi:Alkaline phosphatase [hydrothermal vent metagenome]|uniref:Alkaline phosphatase n=1 Tax=hydrothermal vent metagenome TaxID=652676 RepID=A0A3B0YHI4_9ZZZZ
MKTLRIAALNYWPLLALSLIAGCTTEQAAPRPQQHTQAKNIILFIGDGMGVSTVTAARILEGQLRGEPGEENLLSFEHFPHVALVKTYNTNQQTPDSAGTMSAIMTGEKTRSGVISVNRHSKRNHCKGSQDKSLQTFLEYAEQAGKATGIVTTTHLTHATPAATFAHSPERRWESDSEMPEMALQDGCKDIAVQLIEFPYGDGLEVALGGGRRYFMPNTQTDPELTDRKGQRKDGRDLIHEWLSAGRSAYVWNQAQFKALDLKTIDHLLGLFNYSHMQYEADRSHDSAGEPSLTDMTAKAIDILEKNQHGYFLMVEGGRIDHAHHAGNAYRALTDTIEFSNAIATARNLTNADDTLILVTADHSQVFTMAGYPTRGNPILGKVISNDIFGEPESEPTLARDGKPYTTLGYQNGAGFAVSNTSTLTSEYRAAVGGREQDLSTIDTENLNFHQQALVPLISETHGGEDVALYAEGPGASRVHGVMEQNVIFQIMREAMGL